MKKGDNIIVLTGTLKGKKCVVTRVDEHNVVVHEHGMDWWLSSDDYILADHVPATVQGWADKILMDARQINGSDDKKLYWIEQIYEHARACLKTNKKLE